MMLPHIFASLPPWVRTLKFKVVAMTVGTVVLAAVASTQLALTATQADLKRLLLENERDDGERMAVMLASKLGTLKLALESVAQKVTPAELQDPAAMARILVEQRALAVMFDTVFAAGRDGTMVARAEQGMARAELPSIADRDYFKQALESDNPVVSEPLTGRVSKAPILIVAAPVFGPGGRSIGVVAGSVALRSARLFSNLAGMHQPDGSRMLVMSRSGLLLAHPNAARMLGNAADEPGLAAEFARWRAAGSPIETRGTAVLSGGYMVSMAGIPTSDWVLVHITPEALALAPVAAAARTAWRAAIAVGLAAALLAGWLAWHLTRPISRLRERAELMLTEEADKDDAWPQASGEVGQLAQAFRLVVAQRQSRQRETEALLRQLGAVLDHADVGIALTRNGRFELVSQQFCSVFRGDRVNFVGESTRTIHASDAAHAALSEQAHPAFMERGTFDGEFELVRRNGQPFWARMRGRAVAHGDRSQGTIWTVEDVTEMREKRERLSWASSHDSLTGLANRAAFEVLLEHASAHAASRPFCALFIDLDRFKQVNDTGGHAAGDALLRDVALVLAAQVRKSDTVARMGGDEFAVLLDHCPVSQARAIAEKMRSAVIAYELVWEGRTHSVGASIGLVPVDAALASATEVLRAADAACYAAKRQGRNRVALHVAA